MSEWNEIAKRILKSEMVLRGINHSELVKLLNKIGVHETKSSVDSKICRGTFSAAFLIQCLTAMGCEKIDLYKKETYNMKVAESSSNYNNKEFSNG